MLSHGRTDAEAEVPIFWTPQAQLIHWKKNLMLLKVEGRRRRGRQNSEMVGWHYQLKANECKQTLGDSEGQGRLACCSPWVWKEVDTTERLNNKSHDVQK